MRLLPEYRKAARSFDDSEVGFGTVDCTIHINLCHMVSMFYLSTGGNSSVTQLVSRKGNLHFSIQESFTATTQYFPSLRCPHHGPVSRKSRKLFGREKPFVKLRLASSGKPVFSYVLKGIKIKINAKFRASRRLRSENFRDFRETSPMSLCTSHFMRIC